MVLRGMGVGVALAAALWGADTTGARETTVRRTYTVGVDSRTGKLVRVPATRYSRPVASRTVVAKTVPEKPVPPKVVEPLEVSSEPAARRESTAVYNVAAGRSFDRLIEEVASTYQIHPGFVRAVIKAESNYNPRAISPKGALGLMQLMPQTARRFGVQHVFNPAENLEGGVRYLRYLLDLYGGANWTLSLAAYNAGEGAVDRFGGIPPYTETRQYVRRVRELYQRFHTPLAPAPAPKKLEGPRILQVVDASGATRYITEAQ